MKGDCCFTQQGASDIKSNFFSGVVTRSVCVCFPDFEILSKIVFVTYRFIVLDKLLTVLKIHVLQ